MVNVRGLLHFENRNFVMSTKLRLCDAIVANLPQLANATYGLPKRKCWTLPNAKLALKRSLDGSHATPRLMDSIHNRIGFVDDE